MNHDNAEAAEIFEANPNDFRNGFAKQHFQKKNRCGYNCLPSLTFAVP